MATDNRKVSVFSVEDDVRALIKAKQELNSFVAKVTAARAEFERSNRSTDAVVTSTNKITNAVLEAKKAYEDGIITVKEYNRVIAEAAKPVKQNAPQRSTQETVDRFGTFGSQVFGAFGAGELGNAAGLVGDLASGIGTLNPLIVAGTVATGALTLALNAMQEEAKRGAEALKQRLAAEREVNSFLRTATTEQAQNRLEDLRSQLAFEQSEFERIQAERNAFIQEANKPTVASFLLGNTLGRAITTNFQQLGVYTDSLTENAQRQSDLTTQIRELSFAVAGGEQAANDAKIAEEDLARARADAITDALQGTAERVRFEQQLRDANAETTRKLLETETDRREVLQAQIDSLSEVADQDENVRIRLTELNSELANSDLNIQRLTDRLQALSGIKGFVGIFESIGSAIQSKILSPIQRNLEEQAEKAKRLEEATRPILDEIAKLGQESLKREAEFAQKRFDIEAAYAEQTLRDAMQYTRQRIKIERDAASSALSAVARRDQIAFKEARTRREEQLDDLRAQAEDEAAIRERDRRAKLDALNREIQDFRQTNSQKRYELQRQYQYEIAAENARLTTQQSAAIARATIEQSGSNTVLGIAQTFWQRMVAQAQAAANAQLVSAIGNTVPGIQSSDGITSGIVAGLRRSAY